MKCFEGIGMPVFKQQKGRSEAVDLSDDTILHGAKSIAKALAIPGGQASLDFVVARYLGWFDAAQARGMSWKHMTDVLFAAGAKRETGERFSTGHLSAVVWRQRKQSDQTEITDSTPTGTRRGPIPIGQPIAAPLKAAASKARKNSSKRTSRGTIDDRTTEVRRRTGDRKTGSDPNVDIRASMNRAARLRRQTDND
jgi:hypothetical protein